MPPKRSKATSAKRGGGTNGGDDQPDEEAPSAARKKKAAAALAAQPVVQSPYHGIQLPPWVPARIEYSWRDVSLSANGTSLGSLHREAVLPWSSRRGVHVRYVADQKLAVFLNDEWHEATVVSPPVAPKLTHAIDLDNGKRENVFLSPWRLTLLAAVEL